MAHRTARHVYLARHGQTEWNLLGRRQGRLDSPLTEQGVRQAERNALLVASLPIDHIYSSPLGRAYRSAVIMAKYTGVPVTVLDELAEVDHGALSGLTDDEVKTDFPHETERRAQDKYTYRFPDGESYADASFRADRAIARIRSEQVAAPLIVSHEMIGRLLILHLAGLDVPDALAYTHPHDTVYRIDCSIGAIEPLRLD